uniref:Uncharacterized protein n=1 Tax=Arundo donax TaxID=35708 RepID=A0A0A9BNJ1_ARUDO
MACVFHNLPHPKKSVIYLVA